MMNEGLLRGRVLPDQSLQADDQLGRFAPIDCSPLNDRSLDGFNGSR
jgi:hypothetical protein